MLWYLPKIFSRSRKEQAHRMCSKGINVRANKITFCSHSTKFNKYLGSTGIISVSCFFLRKLRIVLVCAEETIFHFLNKHELVFDVHHLTLQPLNVSDNG